ncbi:bifunctional folylpolyglutamate synthase/dihydrofolate synthase [Leuconostoc pseudomesenteroides]|uniref:bifunctional folylpolyglutamate synthase/dihydrofolate synthase n=1 Tax=Leuconostoc pseudomesenteroides TaxID=33968 RepID=UPI001E3D9917|nr:Mur ligase family protein [Leuconostoc pseudomesenteroides]MCC7668339.1 bifunctional folylpolyglutamate synthase/dihydrofolate synthase [Leuconostoc pseudomesenteroides]
MRTVAEAIAYIHSRPKGGQKESLERMHALLNRLGNPEKILPPAIHVTGTNGKGSVATMSSNILQSAGLHTGLFISPFITDFRERIQVDNKMIASEDLLSVTQDVADILIDLDRELAPDIPTEFEVLTAIMFTFFARQDLDALVIEVGIGGLLDSTNVMPNARVAVITSVGLDHQALLGPTIADIARQKAGIIHKNMPVVIGQISSEALSVIKEHASNVIVGQLGEFKPGLPGEYQIVNTATAVAAVRAFDERIPDSAIIHGLASTRFPARFELLNKNLMIDGAHNAQGLHALYKALINSYPTGKIHLIIGSLMDKNVTDSFSEILAQNRFAITLVPFTGPNGRHSLNIEATAKKYPVGTAVNWQTALRQSDADLTVLTGSLYFVSKVREEYAK